jgi:hypothetical protein
MATAGNVGAAGWETEVLGSEVPAHRPEAYSQRVRGIGILRSWLQGTNLAAKRATHRGTEGVGRSATRVLNAALNATQTPR